MNIIISLNLLSAQLVWIYETKNNGRNKKEEDEEEEENTRTKKHAKVPRDTAP